MKEVLKELPKFNDLFNLRGDFKTVKRILFAILLIGSNVFSQEISSGTYHFNLDNAKIEFHESPKYYCKLHRNIGKKSIGFYSNGEQELEKIYCAKCFIDFLDKHVNKAEEIKP